MNTSTISTRINKKTLRQLEKLSKATNRSKSFLAAEAIEKYIDEHSWQIQAIHEGIKEADKGTFATDKEVNKYLAKWGVNED